MNGVPVQREEITNSTCLLSHRGPNDGGFYVDSAVAFGHRRLSIIDLEGGHQPIHNENKTIWLVCNGEIYNYRELAETLKSGGHQFYTKSDSEVILHLYEEYGEECVKQLNGIFAFALYDQNQKRVLLARDHLGVKPLFYCHQSEKFIFASEIKAICQNPSFNRQLNHTALYHFLSLNYTPNPLTLFKNVYALEPGHTLLLCNGKATIRKYWDLDFEIPPFGDQSELQQQTRNYLDQSVKMQLMSDVPVGAFLSGGLDSSLLVHYIKRHVNQPLKTFNVRFKETSYDESAHAQRVARHYGTEHHEIYCTSQDYLNYLPDIIWNTDNLVADISMLPLFMVSKLASQHVKVVLSGDGADEMFAGYPTYMADKYLKYYQRLPSLIKNRLIPCLVECLPINEEKMSFEFKARRFIKGAQLSPQESHYSWRNIFYESDKRLLLNKEILNYYSKNSFWAYERFYQSTRDLDDLSRNLYADLKVWLSDSVLAKVDFMSMAHSLEVRVPFLNPRFVEFSARIPPSLKLHGFTSKYILRQAMKGNIPQKILKRPKVGFNIPIGTWLRRELKELMMDILCEVSIKQMGFFSWEYVEKIIDNHLRNKQDNGFKLLSLIHFCLWYNKFISASKVER